MLRRRKITATFDNGRRVEAVDARRLRIANTLMQTYNVEIGRYFAASWDVDQVGELDDFTKNIGKLPSVERRRRIDYETENIEDQTSKRAFKPDRSAQVWFDVADIVIKNKFDPERFIRRQFVVMPPKLPTEDSKNRVHPERFKTPRAIKNYKAGHGISITEIAAAFRSQRDIFKREVVVAGQSRVDKLDSEQAWHQVLVDDDMPLSALFRYCMARSILKQKGLQHRDLFKVVARTYRAAAAIQYIFEADEYDEVWKDYLPVGWTEKAQQIYRNYFGLDGKQ